MQDMISRLGKRFLNAVGLARLAMPSDFSDKTQKVQGIFKNGGQSGAIVRDGILFIQHYGFASRPVAGSDVMCLFLSGNHESGVAIASHDRRNAPTDIKAGEVCVYHPQTKSRIYLQENGDIRLKPKDGQKIILDGETECTGKFTSDKDFEIKGAAKIDKNLSVKEEISSDKDVTAGQKKISLAQHIHPTSAPGAPTGAPQ